MPGDMFEVITPWRKCEASGPEREINRRDERCAKPVLGGGGGLA